jgi:hypothetical protein
MDNVQNCDSYISIPSSQTYRSHKSLLKLLHMYDVSIFINLAQFISRKTQS